MLGVLCLMLCLVPLYAGVEGAATSRYQKVTEPEDGQTYVFYAEISNNLEMSDSAPRLLKASPLYAAYPEADPQKKEAVTSTDAIVVGNDGESVYTGEDSFAFTVTKVDQTDEGNPGYTIKQVSSGRYLAVTQSLQQPVDAYIYYVYRPGGSAGYAELAGYVQPTYPYVYLTEEADSAAVWYWDDGGFYTRYTTDLSNSAKFGGKLEVNNRENTLNHGQHIYATMFGQKYYQVRLSENSANTYSYLYLDQDDPALSDLADVMLTLGSNRKMYLQGINASAGSAISHRYAIAAQALRNPVYQSYLDWNKTPTDGCATLGVYSDAGDITGMKLLFDSNVQQPSAEKADLTLYKKVLTYDLTVSNGEGSGMYLPGEEVTISAEAQNQTQHFSHWEVTGTAAVRDADSAATTLIMGDGDATVTAVYEDHWVENDDHSCLTAAICGDCGYEILPAQQNHNYSRYESRQNGSSHWSYCTNEGCEAKTWETCMGGQSGYFEKAVCSKCGGEYGGYIADHNAPTGRITVEGHSWNNLPSAFAFETFFNHEVQVTISAEDDSYSQPGYTEDKAVEIAYYIDRSGSPLSEKMLKRVGFSAYTGPISLLEEGTVTVYARLTDHAGNVTYLGSDGILFETDAPQLSGAQDGGTYCETVTLTASDPHLDTVTVNGAPVTVTEGSFEVAPAEGAQTIRATDKAGNETIWTITVNDGHTFTDYHSNGDETCTQDGTKTAVCDFCDATDTVTDEGSRHPHTTTHVAAVAATCTKTGTVEYWHCSECGLNYDAAEDGNRIEDLVAPIDPDNHTLTHVDAVAATCTKIGNLEHWHCEACGRNYDSEGGKELADVSVAIAPNNHTLTHVAAVGATCTQSGSVEHWHCVECGRNYDSVGGKELSSVSTGTNPGNHTLTHIPAVAATCIRSGNLEYWHCSACGQNLNAAGAVLASVTLPVDPDNHNLIRHDGKAATCTEAGYAAYDACTRCGYTTRAEIAPLGHSYGAPEISWSEEGDSCTLTFTCKNDPSHQLVRTVEVSELQPAAPAASGSESSGTTDYTVTVEDESGKAIDVTIPQEEVPASILPELNGGEEGAGGEAAGEEAAQTAQTGGASGTGTALMVGGLILLLIALLLLFLLLKRRRNRSDGEDA